MSRTDYLLLAIFGLLCVALYRDEQHHAARRPRTFVIKPELLSKESAEHIIAAINRQPRPVS